MEVHSCESITTEIKWILNYDSLHNFSDTIGDMHTALLETQFCIISLDYNLHFILNDLLSKKCKLCVHAVSQNKLFIAKER